MVELTESRITRELSSRADFWRPTSSPRKREDASRAFASGEVFTTKLPVEVEIPHGMAHHWLGAVFVPGADVDEVVSWLQEYDEHDRAFR